MERYIIYVLIDPRDETVRYIGKTKNPERRLKDHLRGNGPGYCGNWIRFLLANQLEPVFIVVETCTNNDIACEKEIEWIALGRKLEWNLTNLTDGGEGLNNPAQSVRDAISKSRKGKGTKVLPPEWRKAISEGRKGIIFSKSHIEALSKSHKGKTLSDKAKKKLSTNSKKMWKKRKAEGWGLPEEAKEKISKVNSGRKQSPETIAKRVESRKGYRHSAETIAKIRYSNQNNGFKMPRNIVERLAEQKRGTKRSKESNSKTSQSLKRYYENNPKPETSQETRRKISESKKGNSPAWNKGKSLTEKAKQHLSEINKGKKHTEETKRKIAESSKGKFQTYSQEKQKEISAKIAESKRGKSRSMETRAKIMATKRELSLIQV